MKLRRVAVLSLAATALSAGAFAAPPSNQPPFETVGAPRRARLPAGRPRKLDAELNRRKDRDSADWSRVIVRLTPGAVLPPEFRPYVRSSRRLAIINGEVLELPNRTLRLLEAHPAVALVDEDRPVQGSNYRTSLTVGSRAVNRGYGFTGAGVGVAVVDSGITSWHDDLTNRSRTTYPFGNQRVSAFVDFVNGQSQPYDDEGHGTHVAGIVAGNGAASNGAQAGVAPDASLVVLKVLDHEGRGRVSGVIAALDWVLANYQVHRIRVVNLSVGAAVNESYWTDPLTLAAKRVVDAGIVVVTTAGNAGRSAAGAPQYGAITAPGNAPWVITVGASSTNGTNQRSDDSVAAFSSRGPTAIDFSAKPDLVAPGYGTVSLSDPHSTLYQVNHRYLVNGVDRGRYRPYLSLSGTSMAAPVVSGTIALMLQANPALTPNAVKAILQYTAQDYPGYDPLTEGAGFLNAVGAVRLARHFAMAESGDELPNQEIWSRQIIWGNYRLSGGSILPNANAWAVGTTWGAAHTSTDDNIVWGTWGDDNIVWGTSGDDNIIWGTHGVDDNIIWGTDCGGADCSNVVWGALGDDNIIWGTASGDENIIWGTDYDDNIIWGTNFDENIIWGTNFDENIIWGTTFDDNIVWGTHSADNIIWGTSGDDNIIWGTVSRHGAVLWQVAGSEPVTVVSWTSLMDFTDTQIFDVLDGVGHSGPGRRTKRSAMRAGLHLGEW